MNHLLTIRDQDIFPDAPIMDAANFFKREAGRAIVSDSSGKIALLYVGLYGYHKLPGGGVDEGEDISAALERELLEEIGCKAMVTGEVGKVIEYRDQHELEQTSYCFTAELVGEKGEPDFTDKEREQQFAIVWADGLDDAIALLEKDRSTRYEAAFIQKRDLGLLKAAIAM